MSLPLPTLIPAAFASGSGPNKGLINPLGTITNGVLATGTSLSPNASLYDGFPAADMANPLAGGVAPNGADFNGAFNLVTAFQSWVNAGGKFPFSATLATAIGGYGIGNVVQLNSGLGEVVSLIAGNVQDPNVAMIGWAPWAGPAFAVSQAAMAFNAAGVAPAFTLTPSPALPALATNDCYNVTFSAAGTTGSNTLNVSGLGAKALMQYDLNGNLVPAVITSGLIAVCQYNGTYWVVLDALPSSAISSTQQTLVANEGANGATVPVFKSGVLATNKTFYTIPTPAASTYYDLLPAGNLLNTTTLPANFFVVGKTIKIELWVSATIASGSQTTTYELMLGGVALTAFSAASATGNVIKIEGLITCTAVGASGVASFTATIGVTGPNAYEGFNGTQVTTGISTLVSNVVDVQVQTGSTNVTNLRVINAVISLAA